MFHLFLAATVALAWTAPGDDGHLDGQMSKFYEWNEAKP